MLPHEAIGGGFTARVIFIVEEHKKQVSPNHKRLKEEEALEETLVQDLERISQLCGNVAFTPAGEEAYVSWYIEQDKRLLNGHSPVEDPRFAAYCERRQTHLRKLMIVLSASRGDSLKIDVEDFNRAVQILEAAEVKMGRTFGGLGKARFSDVTEQVKDYMQKMGTTTRSILMAKFYRDVDGLTLKTIEETLQNMGVLKVTLLVGKGDKMYTWVNKDDEEE